MIHTLSTLIFRQEKFFRKFNRHKHLTISSIEWYDAIANVYDLLGDFYKKPRKDFINKLDIREGDVVLDLCAGTGRNIKYLVEKVGKKGAVFAIDSSAKMLNIARKKFNNHTNVHYINIDCSHLSLEVLQKYISDLEKVDHVFCSLGYSVVDNPQMVFDKSFKLLKTNGQYSIMDLFSQRKTVLSAITDLLAFAKSKRETWKIVKDKCKNIYYKVYPARAGEIFVTSGRKK